MRHFQRPRAVDRCCLRLHACVAVWKEGVGLLGIIHAHALTHTLPHTLPHSLTFISHLSPYVPCCCCLLLNPHPQHTHSHTHSHTRTHTHALTHTHSHTRTAIPTTVSPTTPNPCRGLRRSRNSDSCAERCGALGKDTSFFYEYEGCTHVRACGDCYCTPFAHKHAHNLLLCGSCVPMACAVLLHL